MRHKCLRPIFCAAWDKQLLIEEIHADNSMSTSNHVVILRFNKAPYYTKPSAESFTAALHPAFSLYGLLISGGFPSGGLPPFMGPKGQFTLQKKCFLRPELSGFDPPPSLELHPVPEGALNTVGQDNVRTPGFQIFRFKTMMNACLIVSYSKHFLHLKCQE